MHYRTGKEHFEDKGCLFEEFFRHFYELYQTLNSFCPGMFSKTYSGLLLWYLRSISDTWDVIKHYL